MPERRRLLFGLTCLVCCLAWAGPAHALDWEELGEQTVGLGAHEATIAVKSTRRYAKLKIAVKDDPLDLLSIRVTPSSGPVQEFSVGAVISAGGESKVFTLSNAQSLRQVGLGLRVTGSRKLRRRKGLRKARVVVWGAPAKERGRGGKKKKKKKTVWTPLGKQQLNGRSRSVTIRITNSGRMKALGLKVSGHAVDVTSLEIQFAGSGAKTVSARRRLDPADETYAVGLPRAAAIRQVIVNYKAPGSGGAVVHLFGERSASGAPARMPQRGGAWRVLGERILTKGQTRATISVPASKGRCRRLRLRVMTGKVELKEAVVHFLEEGTLRAKLNPKEGKQAKTIEFPEERQVLKVVFTYEMLSSAPALVQVKGAR